MLKPRPKPLQRRRTFLKEWRDYRDLSQEAAADRIGIGRTTIGRIEKGLLPYNQDFLERAAFAYGCEIADLLSRNPFYQSVPQLVHDKLQAAPKDVQDRAAAIVEALLRAS